MFEPNRKSTGTGYTTTVAFLIAAFIFNPAALTFFRPMGAVSVGLATTSSLVCLALAWRTWKKSSHLSIPSIETQPIEPREAL